MQDKDSNSESTTEYVLRASLTSVDFEEGITHIGDYAFDTIGSLTSVKLPSTLESIGRNAFMNQSLWTVDLVLPESVTSLGVNCFQNCGIHSVVIPSGVSTIPSYCFYHCSDLQSARIEGTESIETYAFGFCGELREFMIPDSVLSIGADSFSNCSSLSHIDFEGAAPIIASSAFTQCTALATYPDDTSWTDGVLQDYGGRLCWRGPNTPIMVLPRELTAIDEEAFMGITATQVIISDGVKTIGEKAFADAKNPLYIWIPSSVETIASSAFNNTKVVIFTSKLSPAWSYAIDSNIDVVDFQ